jgi:hypothetical protein
LAAVPLAAEHAVTDAVIANSGNASLCHRHSRLTFSLQKKQERVIRK